MSRKSNRKPLVSPRVKAVVYYDTCNARGEDGETKKLGETDWMSLKEFIDTYTICRYPSECDALLNHYPAPYGRTAYVVVFQEGKGEIPDPRPYIEDRLT